MLDEPLGALDEISREKLQFELIRIWEELKQTIVFITHSVDEALLLANRVIVLNSSSEKVLDQKFGAVYPRDLGSEECIKFRSQIKEALSSAKQKSASQEEISQTFDPVI